ncbi:bifunctional diguanylate cyclase/phosphodiesterase [Methylocystis sp. ATCC 49242]|uniref:putative bifunctional diguanylate cyclase/phosphodiesterase n=1 Tax=Methylocystis sp. ATCC 49242 TaxID=622637 RepID=UPI0001F88041|nr:EAL domain-containing protein [Methylocystis sp. ATCC 49242]
MSLARKLFTVSGDNVELVRAQYAAFSKQIPLLYFILITNSLAICYAFHGVAPNYLSLYLPGALCLFCAARFVFWISHDAECVGDERALRLLQQANRLAIVLSFLFTAWALSLYHYGDAYARGQVAFYIAITVIGCIFCLMHVRSAALLVALVVNVPFILYFLLEDQANLRAMAVNIALVTVAMLAVLFAYYRDFSNLVESRKSLMHKQDETQRLSDENLRLANLDSLTELANRRNFFGALDEAFTAAKLSRRRLAIGVVDLDGFKPVNDTHGHLVGDRLLVEAARRMELCCEGVARLYRLGGDEFALIVAGDPSDRAIIDFGRRLIAVIRAPFYLGELDVRIGSSVGFAVFPDSADTPPRLYERADYALYYAKRHKRGEAILFSQEHEEQIRKYGVIELALNSADLESELSMVFQPIVDARTGRTLALEALARWTSPSLGEVSPANFIPVAERSGFIRRLTKVLLRKALAAANDWPEQVRLSFNLSAHDISAADGVLQIIDIIHRSGVDPRRIDFEITETTIAHDFDQACETIRALKALGVGISLDDFGAGYSSLSHVRNLPLDKIKIDRSFVVDITTNEISYNVVKALQSLSADIGVTCVAEGVERPEQVLALASIGCNIAQGYYFSRPIAEPEVAAYLLAGEREPGYRRAAE